MSDRAAPAPSPISFGRPTTPNRDGIQHWMPVTAGAIGFMATFHRPVQARVLETALVLGPHRNNGASAGVTLRVVRSDDYKFAIELTGDPVKRLPEAAFNTLNEVLVRQLVATGSVIKIDCKQVSAGTIEIVVTTRLS